MDLFVLNSDAYSKCVINFISSPKDSLNPLFKNVTSSANNVCLIYFFFAAIPLMFVLLTIQFDNNYMQSIIHTNSEDVNGQPCLTPR